MKKKSSRDSNLDTALEVLQSLFNKQSGRFSEEYQRLRLEKNWAKIVGNDLAQETFPRKIYKTTLYVACASSEAQYHFRFSEDIILRRINSFVGENTKIDNLSFRAKPKKKENNYSSKAKKFIAEEL